MMNFLWPKFFVVLFGKLNAGLFKTQEYFNWNLRGSGLSEEELSWLRPQKQRSDKFWINPNTLSDKEEGTL